MDSFDFKIIQTLNELDFRQLMDVYEESNRLSGLERYPRLSESEQLLAAENDFYSYLRSFFADTRSLYAVLRAAGRYVAALRLESYRDGLLVEALETAPKARGRGFATHLIGQVLAYLGDLESITVYSHVAKKNAASLAAHNANGFQKIMNHSVFADGSVSHNYYTLCYKI